MDAIVILSESRPLFSSAPDGLDDRTGDLTRVADQIDWTIISNRIFRHALSEGGRREHHVFAAHAGEQVIFLSQPDEVHGSYLKVIRDRVCQYYHIEFEELGDGVGKANVRNGYFPSEEA